MYHLSQTTRKFNTVLVVLMLYFNTSAQLLVPYQCMSHYDINGYTGQYNRALDTKGIITQKKEYHALTISVYGIMNYEAFRETGDSVYYQRVLNQYTYFSDSSRLMFFDNGTTIGLPYHFNFHSMKAPWFSGMTQGVAVSFLIRYYELTGNKQALELAEKMIRLMLKPETKGGALSRTKEDFLWIEEYPNSGSSKSVLNGFINGLIGLKEYCSYFPGDAAAREIHDSCYIAMVESFQYYDTPEWTSYNRNGGAITNSYLRYQIAELDHLYSIYKDERLRDQMRIWSRHAFNKFDKEIHFLKFPLYQFGMKLEWDAAKKRFYTDYSNAFSKGLIVINPNLKLSGRSKLRYLTNGDRYYCEILVKGTMKSDKLKLTLFHDGAKVQGKTAYTDSSVIINTTLPFDEIKVTAGNGKIRPESLELKVYDYTTYQVSLFGFAPLSNRPNLEKGKVYKIDFKSIHTPAAKLFYRYADTEAELKKNLFKIDQSVDLSAGTFVAPEHGVYEFFISYEISNPFSEISKFELIPLP